MCQLLLSPAIRLYCHPILYQYNNNLLVFKSLELVLKSILYISSSLNCLKHNCHNFTALLRTMATDFSEPIPSRIEYKLAWHLKLSLIYWFNLSSQLHSISSSYRNALPECNSANVPKNKCSAHPC